jgi:sortase A
MRRVVRLAGTALTGIGVLLLVWAFITWQWGDPVTSLYTRWEQRKLESRYESLTKSFTPAAPTKPAPGGSGKAQRERSARQAAATRDRIRSSAHAFRKEVDQGQPIGRIRVPHLGLDMLVVAGTDHDSLKKGPGWDERTFMPGEGELTYIAGHRTTYGAPFAHIDRLDKGDLVELDLPYATVRYRVTQSVIVPANDLARLTSHGREVLALQACHPRFSASQRYIVYAKPVRVTGPAGQLATVAAGATR